MTGPAPDCLGHGGPHLTVRAAQELLRERTVPVVATERVALAEACGRSLASPLLAARDVPAFDNAAVDGYAFAHQAGMAESGASLRLAPGRAAAGHPFPDSVPTGRAVRVLTGAPLPAGTDTVVPQERVRVADGMVLVPPGLAAGANRRRAGEDVAAGARLLEAGTLLQPQEIGLAAALGLTELAVHAPLRVALLSSGDELVGAGGTLGQGQVFDANRPILQALLRSLPAVVTDLGILPDSEGAVRAALLAASADHHVVLASGGASHGDEDHVVRVVQAQGRLDFWQIAMKPGHPLAFGRLGDAVFAGLPGNPVAAMVGFLLFARPVLRRLAGFAWELPRAMPVPAAFSLTRRAGRSEYLRGRLRYGASGPVVERIARQGSGMLTSMVAAQGLIELDEARECVQEGELVPWLGFAELGIAV
ncbi:MAG: gephyrin-like molybdotransferase Glp [Geminicoccaceae bacterium]